MVDLAHDTDAMDFKSWHSLSFVDVEIESHLAKAD